MVYQIRIKGYLPGQADGSDVKQSGPIQRNHPYRSKRRKMNTNKKIARIVGALFITAAVTGILSAVLLTPILGDPAYLTKLIENKNQVIMGSLFGMIMA